MCVKLYICICAWKPEGVLQVTNSPASVWEAGAGASCTTTGSVTCPPASHLSPAQVIFTGCAALCAALCVYFCSQDSTVWPFLHRPAAKGNHSSGGFSTERCITAQTFHYGMAWAAGPSPPLWVETEGGRITRLLKNITADKQIHNSDQNTHTQRHLSHWARAPYDQSNFCYQQQQPVFMPASS